MRYTVTAHGGKLPLTRGGTEKTGIHAHAMARDIGVRIHGFPDNGRGDTFAVYITCGAHAPGREKLIGHVRFQIGIGPVFIPLEEKAHAT